MHDRCILARYFISPLSKITNPEHTSLFKLVKDPDSNRLNEILINKTIPVTLFDVLLTSRDTCKKFELQGDLLKKLTKKDYNLDLAKLSDKKTMNDFAKEMYFDERALGTKSTGDKLLNDYS